MYYFKNTHQVGHIIYYTIDYSLLSFTLLETWITDIRLGIDPASTEWYIGFFLRSFCFYQFVLFLNGKLVWETRSGKYCSERQRAAANSVEDAVLLINVCTVIIFF